MKTARIFLIGVLVAVAGILPAGCTRESTRVAIETQRRADAAQQAVFDRQHEAICLLLYRDLLRQLEEAGAPLTPPQRAIVNEAWNDRDLIEFWNIQQERAKALRLVGVDAKLYGDQSIVDLFIKAVEAKVERGEQALAAQVGARLDAPTEPPPESQPGEQP